ncbi:Hypothetical protein NocV09_00600300 [Nannochloropsis oceanica]
MPPPAPVATSAVTTAVLQLYRRIIKNAKVFPSKGRDRMVKEIREEFRVNAKETDPDKIRNHRSMAIKGLSQLQAYTGLVDTDMDWSVTMEPAPLGGLSEEKVEEKLKRVSKATVSSGREGKGVGGKGLEEEGKR